MPYGYNDWLALTQEPTLEPDLPICDPHHHFWDLRPGSVPYQRYLLHELNADIYSGHNIRSTVFLEARSMYRAGGPEELRPVGEVEFVQGLAAASASGVYGESRAAAAIMGHADLKLGADVTPVLGSSPSGQPQPVPRHTPQHHLEHRPHLGQPGDRGDRQRRQIYRRGQGLEPDGTEFGHHAVLPTVGGDRGVRQGGARFANHREPRRRRQPGRYLRRQGRRDNSRSGRKE